jgi:membrane protease YdiL (CAAX protease family)
MLKRKWEIMITNTLNTDAPKSARWKAIAVCVGMFFLYAAILVALLFVLQRFALPYIKAIPMPKNAPVLWWRVDENAALLGLSDLIAALVPVALYCRLRKRSFIDLGFNRGGTLVAWLLVAAGEAWLVYSNIHSGPIRHVPGVLGTYALIAAAIAAPCAAFAEEIFFRGFLLETLRRGGLGVIWQILISGFLFGVAYVGYAGLDWTTMVFTAALGMFWSLVYVLAKRSLWPTIAAHIINDAIVIPSVYYLMVVMRTSH